MPATTTKILLVEDNQADADLIREQLTDTPEGSQCSIEHVACLRDALARLSDDEFHLVLLDLGLADSHGLPTVAHVIEKAPSVPVIVLTGFEDDDLKRQILDAHAQDYFVKGAFDVRAVIKNLNPDQAQNAARHTVERILVYEPDESIAPSVEMALRNVGYTVVPGINPTNFIYEVKTAAPDLIILGLGAGLEEMLIERVRAESDVMIIALASPARIASGEPPPAEVMTWLPKPIDSRSLLWAVKNLSPQAVRT